MITYHHVIFSPRPRADSFRSFSTVHRTVNYRDSTVLQVRWTSSHQDFISTWHVVIFRRRTIRDNVLYTI
jgi:hypothetical protein